MDPSRSGQVDLYFRKVIRKDSDEISLDADMIRLLIAIDENRSLYQIAEEVDMETTTLKTILVMITRKWVSGSPPRTRMPS